MSKVIDITGQRFGNIIITKRMQSDKNGQAQFEYLCDCGNIKIGRGKDIRNGKIISCGCKKKERFINNKVDITGNKYSELTALKYDHTEPSGREIWLFKCSCGKEVLKGKSDVLSGKTTNCGCQTSLLKSPAFLRPCTKLSLLSQGTREKGFPAQRVRSLLVWRLV